MALLTSKIRKAILNALDALLSTSDKELLSIARQTILSLPQVYTLGVLKVVDKNLTLDDLTNQPLTQDQQFKFTNVSNILKNNFNYSINIAMAVVNNDPNSSSDDIMRGVIRGVALSGLFDAKSKGDFEVDLPILPAKKNNSDVVQTESPIHITIAGTSLRLCAAACMSVDIEKAEKESNGDPEKFGKIMENKIMSTNHIVDVLGVNTIQDLAKLSEQITSAYTDYLKQKEAAKVKDPGAIAFESYISLLQNSRQIEQMQNDRSSLQDIIDKYNRDGFI
jgi:hypothetical protein